MQQRLSVYVGLLALSLLSGCASAPSPRCPGLEPLSPAMAAPAPPEGAYRACLTELLTARTTSGPACTGLRTEPIDSRPN